MADYNFQNLSPFEFEQLSRDLLQKKMAIDFESFTEGKDGGIDFRYISNKKHTHIVQVKRIREFASLVATIKKEKKKIDLLKPAKYTLVISIGLTPDQKSKLIVLLAPYIKTASSIITRDDLNNFLSQYPEIEKKHYKLWMSSTEILNSIFHKKIINQSNFEIQEISENAKYYVQNDSFVKAINILKDFRYVIISGIPGIGKTTLARALTLWVMRQKYEEFVYLSDTIDEAYSLFSHEKSQVFFFDDFLGKNFFSARDVQNVDEKIVKFIERVKRSTNKLIIFTTREYILKLAQDSFEVFNTKSISLAKCTINLISYTRLIKAKIIYNHLFFSDVPRAHLNNIIVNGNYLTLINHPNYNPRILETVLLQKIWQKCKPDQFSLHIKKYFDNPDSIWLHTFENNLNKLSQYTLLVLATFKTPAPLENLRKAICEFFAINKIQIFFDEINFQKTIRQIEDTFIKTYLSGDIIFIQYQNPSILDFLVNYLRNKISTINQLIDSMIFADQFQTIFTPLVSKVNNAFNARITLSSESMEKMAARVDKILLEGELSENTGNSQAVNLSKPALQFALLCNLNEDFGNYYKSVDDIILNRFIEQILKLPNTIEEQLAYIRLVSIYRMSPGVKSKATEILLNFTNCFVEMKSVKIFHQFKHLLPNEYADLIKRKRTIAKIIKVANNEIKRQKDGDLRQLIKEFEWIEKAYQINLSQQIEKVESIIEEYYSEIAVLKLKYTTIEYVKSEDQLSYEEEMKTIKEMFNCLV